MVKSPFNIVHYTIIWTIYQGLSGVVCIDSGKEMAVEQPHTGLWQRRGKVKKPSCMTGFVIL